MKLAILLALCLCGLVFTTAGHAQEVVINGIVINGADGTWEAAPDAPDNVPPLEKRIVIESANATFRNPLTATPTELPTEIAP